MRRTLLLLTTMVAGVLLASGVALAAAVSEVEPNDSIAGAQEIAAASFDLTANFDIYDSTTVPHATVNGTGEDPKTFDYYKFTVPAGPPVRVVLDMDYTTPDGLNRYDSWIELYDSSGELIAFNDDYGFDPGSLDLTDFRPDEHDSLIGDISNSLETPLDPGTYVVKVGAYEEAHIGVVSPAGSTYQLHVSVGNPPDTTPPSVEVASPADLETGVATTANVTATFSEQVQGVTRRTFTLERVGHKKGVEQFRAVRAQVTTALVGTGADAVTQATLDPVKDLPSGTYRVTVTTGVTDLAGNPLGGLAWRFTVASPPPA